MMIIIGLACGLAAGAFVMAVMALAVAGWGIAEIRGYKLSTHNVQFVSAEEAAKEKEADDMLNKFYDDIQTKQLNEKMGEVRDEQ